MFIPDPGSEFFAIPDPGSDFFHPGSQSRITDSGSASKNLGILTQKNRFRTLENMIRSCLSQIRILFFFIHPGSRGQKAPDPGSGSATQYIDGQCRFDVEGI